MPSRPPSNATEALRYRSLVRYSALVVRREAEGESRECGLLGAEGEGGGAGRGLVCAAVELALAVVVDDLARFHNVEAKRVDLHGRWVAGCNIKGDCAQLDRAWQGEGELSEIAMRRQRTRRHPYRVTSR